MTDKLVSIIWRENSKYNSLDSLLSNVSYNGEILIYNLINKKI